MKDLIAVVIIIIFWIVVPILFLLTSNFINYGSIYPPEIENPTQEQIEGVYRFWQGIFIAMISSIIIYCIWKSFKKKRRKKK